METASFDVEAYLASKGYAPKRGSSGELHIPCFFCGEAPDSRKRKLYINTRTGFYHCKVCEAKGGTTLLMRHFGDEAKDADSTPVPKRSKVLEQATEVGQSMLVQNDDQMLYLLSDRGLSPETILERRLGYVGGAWSLVGNLKATKEDVLDSGLVWRDGPRQGQDFFYDHLLIPYLSRGRVVQMRGKVLRGNHAGKYMTGPGERVRIYGEDAFEDCDDVVITEGEFDGMILAQHLALSPDPRVRAYGVASLAGANAVPDDFDELCARARRIFLAFDPDDVGKAAAIKLKDRLGAKARIVELPDDTPKKCDWTYYFTEHGGDWRSAMALIGGAEGKRIFSFAEASRAFHAQRSVVSGYQSGYSQLDSVIDPGLLPGQLVVFLAKTGTGKTILLCNLAFNMRRYRVLFISLEQTQEEVYERLARIYRHHFPLATEAEMDMAYGELRISDANRVDEDTLDSLIEEYEVEIGEPPEIVMVDYLGYFARAARGRSPYEKVSNAVMNLKAVAKARRVVMIAPHQVNRVAKEGKPIEIDDARDSGVVEETADFLLSFWRLDDGLKADENVGPPTGKLRAMVNKSRHGGKGRQFSVQMDPLTLAIVEEHTDAAKKAVEHNYRYWRGETYQSIRAEETAPEQQQMEV